MSMKQTAEIKALQEQVKTLSERLDDIEVKLVPMAARVQKSPQKTSKKH